MSMFLSQNLMTNNVSFGSIKAEKRICEDTLREFHKKYPQEFQSNTKVDLKISKRQLDFSDWLKYNSVSEKHGRAVSAARNDYYKEYNSWESYIEALKKATNKHKAANCGEQADLLTDEFFKKGLEVHKVQVEYKPIADHAFLVFNAKENADWTNPKTWGNKAIIVDPWSNFVLQAREALEQFTKAFNPNSAIKEVYSSVDVIDVKNYLKG